MQPQTVAYFRDNNYLLYKIHSLIGLGIPSGIQAILSYIFIADWKLWIVPPDYFHKPLYYRFCKGSLQRQKKSFSAYVIFNGILADFLRKYHYLCVQ